MATNNAVNVGLSGSTGTGTFVGANTPTLITPVLGVASATSINKVAFTAPATSATLVIADGKTLTQSNTLTYTGTDGSTINFGTGGTVAYTGGSGVIVTASIAGTTQAAAVNTRYIVANAGATTITLPATFAIGDVVIIKGLGAGGWILTATAGDTIQIGSSATSAGGTLTSANQYDTVYVSGLVANTTWSVDYVLSAGLTVA